MVAAAVDRAEDATASTALVAVGTLSRGFHLPDEGVFFSLDVGIPLVQGTEPPPAAEDETGRDDEWERTKEQVRKGTTRDYNQVWLSEALEGQKVTNLELDPAAIRELEDVTLRTLARHASRIEGLSQNDTITVAFHLTGSGSMPMVMAPDDEDRDAHWLTFDSFGSSVEKRLVIRVALADLTGFGADGTGLDRVRQRARVYEY